MIKNYISENISYLLKKSDQSQDDFGLSFDVGKGLISNYVNGRALPKIETIQRICLHYKITIDDFINKDLKTIKYNQDNKTETLHEPLEGYGLVNLKYVELLENSVRDKDEIIDILKNKLGHDNDKSIAG